MQGCLNMDPTTSTSSQKRSFSPKDNPEAKKQKLDRFVVTDNIKRMMFEEIYKKDPPKGLESKSFDLLTDDEAFLYHQYSMALLEKENTAVIYFFLIDTVRSV